MRSVRRDLVFYFFVVLLLLCSCKGGSYSSSEPTNSDMLNLSNCNVDGLWNARGYFCDGELQPAEVVEIKTVGDTMYASKVTGDDCVSSGELTWKGIRDQNGIRVFLKYALEDGGHDYHPCVALGQSCKDFMIIVGENDTLRYNWSRMNDVIDQN